MKNAIWCNDDTIKGYEPISTITAQKLSETTNGLQLRTNPQEMVHAVYALATGERQQFRTIIGANAVQTAALRASLPMESYLEKIAACFS